MRYFSRWSMSSARLFNNPTLSFNAVESLVCNSGDAATECRSKISLPCSSL